MIRAALVISTMSVIAACVGSSDGDVGGPQTTPIGIETSVEPPLGQETADPAGSASRVGPPVPDPQVTVAGGADPVTGATTTTVETVDVDAVFESLDALDGLLGQFDSEVASIDLQEEGVNP